MSDILMRQGDSYVFDVYATRAGAQVDLTGGKVWFTMKHNRRDADAQAIIQHDSGDPSQQVRILNAVSGIIRVKIAPNDTVNLPASYYPYDVQVLEADNTISTIQSGFVELDRATTKAVT